MLGWGRIAVLSGETKRETGWSESGAPIASDGSTPATPRLLPSSLGLQGCTLHSEALRKVRSRMQFLKDSILVVASSGVASSRKSRQYVEPEGKGMFSHLKEWDAIALLASAVHASAWAVALSLGSCMYYLPRASSCRNTSESTAVPFPGLERPTCVPEPSRIHRR